MTTTIEATTHAWFSHEAALLHGSSTRHKASGSAVNVTRVSAVKELAGRFKLTEKYLGEVMPEERGGGLNR